jgi:hypothetical protein
MYSDDGAGMIVHSCYDADPTPPESRHPSAVAWRGRGIGGEYLGRLTMARSRLRACDI